MRSVKEEFLETSFAGCEICTQYLFFLYPMKHIVIIEIPDE